MVEAPKTLDGWWVLHDLSRLDRRLWRSWAESERADALAQAGDLWQHELTRPKAAERGDSGLYTVLGHKGELLQIHLRESLEDLFQLQHQLAGLAIAACLERTWSFVSVVELSTYGAAQGTELPDAPLDDPRLKSRLHPLLPDGPFVSVYPMNKTRRVGANWYTLTLDERRMLMRGHGEIGRRYAGRVSQMISGAIGLDDWEWAVTLFSADPLEFKRLVTDMRYDPVSSLYAEFGPFLIGRRIDPGALTALWRR
ncbi:MAG: hydrogen peroxide-dependent heme synthase [Sulfobacillus sp.]